MKPTESVAAFEAFSKSSGASLLGLGPLTAFSQMFGFYEGIAPEGCSASSGDMLLYQWGTYDSGKGLRYHVDVTRQFIEVSKSDDDAISQLSLTFAFAPTEELKAFGLGNRWCKNQSELASFRTFVLSSPQLGMVAERDPLGAFLRHEYV